MSRKPPTAPQRSAKKPSQTERTSQERLSIARQWAEHELAISKERVATFATNLAEEVSKENGGNPLHSFEWSSSAVSAAAAVRVYQQVVRLLAPRSVEEGGVGPSMDGPVALDAATILTRAADEIEESALNGARFPKQSSCLVEVECHRTCTATFTAAAHNLRKFAR